MRKRSVGIYLRVSEGQGKQPYHPACFAANKTLKPLYAVISGKPTHRPDGHYYIRFRTKEGKRRYEYVGKDASLALTKKKQREVAIAAEELGMAAPVSEPVLRMPKPADAGLGSVATMVNPQAPALDAASGRLGLSSTIDRFVKDKEITTTLGRAREYRFQLGDFLSQTTCTYLDEIGDSAAISYIASLLARGKSARTVENRIATLTTFLRENGVVRHFKKHVPKPLQVMPRVYEEETVRALFTAANNEELVTFMFFLGLGLREREVMFSAWTDINWRTKRYRVTQKPTKGFVTKNRKEREVPIPANLYALLLQRYEAEHHADWIFPTRNGLPNGHLLRMLQELAFRTRLNCGRCVTRSGKQNCGTSPCCRQFGLHMFRRTFATMHHEAGVPLRTLMAWLGHSHLETTELYLGITKSESGAQNELADNTWRTMPLLGQRAA